MTSATLTAAAPLTIRGVAKKFGSNQALAGISLDLHAGECLGLLGPNGAGKSTLVRSVVGRVLPDAGSISVLGSPAGSDAARRAVGYIPQELALYPLLSAAENLEVFGRYQGLQGTGLKDAIVWALRWSALHDRAAEPVKNFSGGMKRRLNMAAGLLHRPSVVLLDEPTVGVDPQSRERIYAMIAELRQGGSSLLYTTHYMEEAERLCDRIAVVDHGTLIALGTRDELVRGAFGTQADVAITLGSAPSSDDKTWLASRGAHTEGSVIRLTVSQPAEEVGELLAEARRRNLRILDLALRAPNLESVFLKLTGRELRE